MIARIVTMWLAASVVSAPLIGMFIRGHVTAQPAIVPVSPRRH